MDITRACSSHDGLCWRACSPLFRTALAQTPDNALSHVALGMALYAWGHREGIVEAAGHFQMGISLGAHEGDPLTLYRAAMVYEDAVRIVMRVWRVCALCTPCGGSVHARALVCVCRAKRSLCCPR